MNLPTASVVNIDEEDVLYVDLFVDQYIIICWGIYPVSLPSIVPVVINLYDDRYWLLNVDDFVVIVMNDCPQLSSNVIDEVKYVSVYAIMLKELHEIRHVILLNLF